MASCVLVGCGASVPRPVPPLDPSVELVVNEGFEQTVIAEGTARTLPSIAGWSLASGPGIELQRRIAGAPFAGAQLLELDSDAPSAIAQTIATTPGAIYELALAYSPRPGIGTENNRVDVFFAGRRVLRIEAPGANETRWARVRMRVQATQSASRLELRDAGASDSVGGYLDAISLRATGEVLPVIAPLRASGGELLTNGDFEKPMVAGGFETVTALSGWTLASGAGVEIQRGVAGAPFEGAQHAELDADAPSAITQTVPAIEGGLYDLSFAYAPRPGVASNPIAISLGDHEAISIDASGEGLSDALWFHVTIGAQARSDHARVELRDTSAPDGLGGYLDAVSLSPTPAPSARAAGS